MYWEQIIKLLYTITGEVSIERPSLGELMVLGQARLQEAPFPSFLPLVLYFMEA